MEIFGKKFVLFRCRVSKNSAIIALCSGKKNISFDHSEKKQFLQNMSIFVHQHSFP